MLTSDDKVGGWVKKGQNHHDVILEWSLNGILMALADLSFFFGQNLANTLKNLLLV
jgi:hypothetical protein